MTVLTNKILVVVSIIVFLLTVSTAQASEHDIEKNNRDFSSEKHAARIYRNPEERREAGLGTQLTEQLKFSGLLEFEKEYFENNTTGNQKQRIYGDTISSTQFAFELEITEWLGAELIYEFELDSDRQTGKWDEIFFSFEFDEIGVGVEVGRVSAPFGEYYSHFVTGPLLEFGETIKNGLIVDYSLTNRFELIGFMIDSDIEKRNKNTEYDWGAAIEFNSKSEALRLGLGYLSDLAESDERFLEDEGNFYENRVSAWNAYSLIGFDKFELTAELVQANGKFREFDNSSDKPFAYNLELAYFPNSLIQFAARYEGSDEISDQPKKQYGVSATWRPVERISVAAEYLHGKYKNNFVFDDNNRELEDRDVFAAQMSIEF